MSRDPRRRASGRLPRGSPRPPPSTPQKAGGARARRRMSPGESFRRRILEPKELVKNRKRAAVALKRFHVLEELRMHGVAACPNCRPVEELDGRGHGRPIHAGPERATHASRQSSVSKSSTLTSASAVTVGGSP